MDDDFNTPEAMAVLFDLAREVNRLQESNRAVAGQLAARLRRLAAVLGLLQSAPEHYLRHGSVDDGPADAEVQDWVTRRTEARARKDWQEADRIRVRLAAQGGRSPTARLGRRRFRMHSSGLGLLVSRSSRLATTTRVSLVSPRPNNNSSRMS